MYKKNGFTIVELLIVIVVIAILAAISIVAYSGIQQRAKNSQMLASFDAAEKAVRLYHAETGEYPETQDENGGLIGKTKDGDDIPYACLGQPSDYPAIDELATGECYTYEGVNYGVNSSLINERLSRFTPNLYVGSGDLVRYDDGASGGIRGVLYAGTKKGAVLFYMQKGDRECGRGSKDVGGAEDAPESRVTTCGITLGDF